ncbi:MAG: hypothetical protein JWS10_2372 [Cypionkella sp.]|nr:hypothetical protein [Cypionkella sp.]
MALRSSKLVNDSAAALSSLREAAWAGHTRLFLQGERQQGERQTPPNPRDNVTVKKNNGQRAGYVSWRVYMLKLLKNALCRSRKARVKNDCVLAHLEDERIQHSEGDHWDGRDRSEHSGVSFVGRLWLILCAEPIGI